MLNYEILSNDISGDVSELSLLNSLIFISSVLDIDLNNIINSVIKDIIILNRIVYKERIPRFSVMDSCSLKNIYYSTRYLDYSFDIESIIKLIYRLNINIRSHINVIKNKKTIKILNYIVKNNKKYVKLLKEIENNL